MWKVNYLRVDALSCDGVWARWRERETPADDAMPFAGEYLPFAGAPSDGSGVLVVGQKQKAQV